MDDLRDIVEKYYKQVTQSPIYQIGTNVPQPGLGGLSLNNAVNIGERAWDIAGRPYYAFMKAQEFNKPENIAKYKGKPLQYLNEYGKAIWQGLSGKDKMTISEALNKEYVNLIPETTTLGRALKATAMGGSGVVGMVVDPRNIAIGMLATKMIPKKAISTELPTETPLSKLRRIDVELKSKGVKPPGYYGKLKQQKIWEAEKAGVFKPSPVEPGKPTPSFLRNVEQEPVTAISTTRPPEFMPPIKTAPEVGMGGLPATPPEQPIPKEMKPPTYGEPTIAGIPPTEPPTTTTAGMVQPTELPKYAYPNINLERINTPVEIKQQINDWSLQNKDLIDKTIPPHITNEEVIAEANNIASEFAFNPKEIIKATKKYFPMDNRRQLGLLQALRNFGVTNENRIAELQKMLKTTVKNSDEELQAMIELTKATADRDAYMASYSGASRIAGQTLQARKILASGRNTAFDRITNLQNFLNKNLGDKVGTPKYEQLMTGLRNLDVNDPLAIHNYLKNFSKATFGDHFWAYWYNNVLSGVPTNVINFTGNAIKGFVEKTMVEPLANLIDLPLSKLPGRTRAYTWRGSLASMMATTRGVRKGNFRALYIMKNGIDPEDIMGYSKWGFERMANIEPNAPGLSMSTRAMRGADAWFKGLWSETKKAELAVNKFYDKTKSIKEIATNAEKYINESNPELLNQTDIWARKLTFNEMPGEATKAMINLRNKAPILKPIMPFINISANLMKQGLRDFSPAGFLRRGWIGKGTNPELAAHLARASIGTGLMATGYLLVKSGDMTLRAPSNPTQRDQWYAEGKQPYSIKIANHWIPIRRIEPFCYPLMIGGIIGNYLEKNPKAANNTKFTQNIFDASIEIGKMLGSASYLATLTDFINLIEGGSYNPAQTLQGIIARTATGAIPYSSFLKNIAQTIDPTVKEYNLNIPQYMASQLPGLSTMISVRKEKTGREMIRPGGRLRGFMPIVPTLAVTPTRMTARRNELLDVIEQYYQSQGR